LFDFFLVGVEEKKHRRTHIFTTDNTAKLMETSLDILIAERRDLKEYIRRISKTIDRMKSRQRYTRKHPKKTCEEMIQAKRLHARKYYHRRKQMMSTISTNTTI
jgi:hypothetical protein